LLPDTHRSNAARPGRAQNNKLFWWRYGSEINENATLLHPAGATSLPDDFSAPLRACNAAIRTPQHNLS